MKWYNKLYVSPAMEKRKIKIKWKLNVGAGVIGTYLIVLPLEGSNQLEIINAKYMKQSFYRKRAMIICGMAESVESATDIVVSIAEEVYKNTDDLQIKKYLLDKCNEEIKL